MHYAIFDAFDRFDEHMYEFQLGKEPHHRKNKRYELPMAMEESCWEDEEPAADLTRTTIGSLGFKVGQLFWYWFDFGDDWWHRIDVVAVEEKAARGKYPKVTGRIGKSPPQYVDWDE